jgi:rubrerythrin
MVHQMTESNLISAYCGESQAHMRYLIFAKRATDEGYPNISRLFKAVAHAERIHASNHYRNIMVKGGQTTVGGALFGSRSTIEDLQHGLEGERHEIDEMYPAYIAVAKDQVEYGAEITFKYAWEAEKTHLALYENAKQVAEQKHDVQLGKIGVCEVCGYTVENDIPEKCPICKAKQEKFVIF